MIYLDNSATTRPFSEVLQSFNKVSEQYYANPSSVHSFGSNAERLLEQSRNRAAKLLGVQPQEVIFTSGGTEGNNMALKGVALMHQSRGKHIITSQVEHPSVIEACRGLETLGFEVTYLGVDFRGRIDPAEVREAIRDDTILVSIMSVNNEMGTIQPIEEVGHIASQYPKIYFHVDHVQGLGKIPFNMKQAGVDLCTVSGHKVHGLKGTGALIVQQHVSLFPLLHGGSQEGELRAGTQNLPGIIAFVKALRLTQDLQRESADELVELRQYLWEELEKIDKVVLNSPVDGAPHIINFSIPGYKPEVVIHALGEKDIFISTKSACSSKQPDISSVLQACNLEHERTTSALRVSMSYQNTKNEITTFIQQLKQTVEYLQPTMRRS